MQRSTLSLQHKLVVRSVTGGYSVSKMSRIGKAQSSRLSTRWCIICDQIPLVNLLLDASALGFHDYIWLSTTYLTVCHEDIGSCFDLLDHVLISICGLMSITKNIWDKDLEVSLCIWKIIIFEYRTPCNAGFEVRLKKYHSLRWSKQSLSNPVFTNQSEWDLANWFREKSSYADLSRRSKVLLLSEHIY